MKRGSFILTPVTQSCLVDGRCFWRAPTIAKPRFTPLHLHRDGLRPSFQGRKGGVLPTVLGRVMYLEPRPHLPKYGAESPV